jgi:hypothetical protein
VQLDKGITYVGATITPDMVGTTNSTLSINVKANIVSAITNADTHLTVWKDGELFVSAYIQDLCTIVRASTSALHCPIAAGTLSFTYTFDRVPALVSGYYRVMLESSVAGSPLGCLELRSQVNGLKDPSSCWETSSFAASLDGDRKFSENYTYIQVGPYGQVNSNSNSSWGIAKSIVGTQDVGGTVAPSNYVWGVNGTARPQATKSDTYIYDGDFFVGYQTATTIETVFIGKFNWTIVNPQSGENEINYGFFWPDPKYSYPSSIYTYPTVLGNLGPFAMRKLGSGYMEISGQRDWCTCGYDSCGVCSGDGSTCLELVSTQSEWSTYRKTAVGVGVAGGFIGFIAVGSLFYVLLKTKSRNQRRHDDQDLIDTPEKPDYGTLAIDEVIHEGESGPIV